MEHLLEFVINTTHTNVILMSAPHRYDLMRDSCIIKERGKFNRKLCIRLEKLRKVETIDVVSDRNWYTSHRQCLNSEGKESMAKKIASTIERVLNKKVEPIHGKWYTGKETDILDRQPVQGKIDSNLEEGNSEFSVGVLHTLKVNDSQQKCDCQNMCILVIVDRKSPKRPRR
jgi:hypothetical protein